MLEPPKEVEPGELFRLLLQKPRPWWDTDEGRVVALTATERAGIEQATARLPSQAAWLARSRHEVALCLHDESGPQFGSADELGDLKPYELRRLIAAVRSGLRVCCPEYGYCNLMAWRITLLAGARSVPAIAGMIGSCIDEGARKIVSRPDRWFGLPLSELTDGQWMAYHAGRAYVDEQAKQSA